MAQDLDERLLEATEKESGIVQTIQKTNPQKLGFWKHARAYIAAGIALAALGLYKPAPVDAVSIQAGKDAKGNDVPVMILTPYTAATPDGLGQKGGGAYQTPGGTTDSPSLQDRQKPKKDDAPPSKPSKDYEAQKRQAERLLRDNSLSEIFDIIKRNSEDGQISQAYETKFLYEGLSELNQQGKITLTAEEQKMVNIGIFNVNSYLNSMNLKNKKN